MNVFITGGAGFMGSHLTERLLAGGDRVCILDDLSTGQMSNLDFVKAHPRFSYRIGSVLDKPLVSELVDGADYVIHFAAAVGVKLIVEHPVHTIETNVHGADTVLGCAAKKKKPILIASTSEVYGKGLKIPFEEDDDLTFGATRHSRWAYACSKALDEWLAFAYHREKGVPATVTRFFNTVGPRQTGRYGMVLPNFAASAVRNAPIQVYGTGEQSRCFSHVKDVIECVIKLIKSDAIAGEVYNIGANHEISINGLAELVRSVANSSSEIVHVPYEEAYVAGFEDMQRRVPNCAKLMKKIGMVPSTPLEQTVRDVVSEQRQLLG